jgi:hypothetical protein
MPIVRQWVAKHIFAATNKHTIIEELLEMVIYTRNWPLPEVIKGWTIMTYACPAWEFVADNHVLKLQCLQNRVLRTIDNSPRRTPTRDLHMAFKLLYIYDYTTKLCRQQTEVIQNRENADARNIGQSEPDTGNIRGLNLAAVKHTTVQMTRLLL